MSKSYVEHTAVFVSDLDYHIKFFAEVFNMTVTKTGEKEGKVWQVWLSGGVQLVEDKTFKGAEGRLAHLGIMVENMEETLEKAYARGACEMVQGRNWFIIPSGLSVEVMEANNNAVERILAIDPR